MSPLSHGSFLSLFIEGAKLQVNKSMLKRSIKTKLAGYECQSKMTAQTNNCKLRLKHKERQSSGPSAVQSGAWSRAGTQDARNKELSSAEQEQPIVIFESPE